MTSSRAVNIYRQLCSLFILLVITASADAGSTLDLSPIGAERPTGNTCGYADSSGKIVIPLVFDRTWEFKANGLARVRKNGKYGFINARGQYVIEPTFWYATDFNENGLARITQSQNGGMGFINSRGEVVIQPTFKFISEKFSHGLAQFMDKSYQIGRAHV